MPFVFDGFVYAGCLVPIKTCYKVKFTDGTSYSSICEEKVKDEITRRNIPVRGNGIFAKSAGWGYRLINDKRQYTKSIQNSIAGTEEKAKEITMEYGRKVSDELRLTRKAEIPPCPDHLKEDWKREYVAGFFDGDGSVEVGSSIKLSIKQSQRIGEPAVIRRFKDWFPRFKNYVQMSKKASHRPCHKLEWNGEPSYSLLMCSEDYGIIKRAQSAVVRPLLDNYFLSGKYDWGLGTGVLSEHLSTLKENYAGVEINSTRLTDAYISGLFDAEGCISGDSSDYIQCSISQESCPRLLIEIQKRVGGNIPPSNPGKLRIFGDTLVQFLRRIRPYSIQKLSQIDLALECLKLRCAPGKRLRDEVRERKQEIARELKRLKRI